MALADPPAIISAAPTVRVAGTSFPELTKSIQAMRVSEQLGGLSSLELSLYDSLSFPDGKVGWGGTASSPLQLGAAITIYAGNTATPQSIFDGAITAIEGEYRDGDPPIFTVLAEDRLWKARRLRRSRIFEGMTPADIVKRIAGDHALTPDVEGLDAPTTTWAQLNESDLAFLRRVLARVDGDLQCVDDTLQAMPRAGFARTTVWLTLGAQLIRARVTADLADQATSVGVGGYDGTAGERVSATATSGAMGPGRGTDGASVLRRAFGAVVEHLGHQDALTDAEARLVAEAHYGERARRFVRIDGAAQGDPQIRVGTRLSIAGVNPFFENDYSVTQATHRFDAVEGYVTDFLAECAYVGAGA